MSGCRRTAHWQEQLLLDNDHVAANNQNEEEKHLHQAMPDGCGSLVGLYCKSVLSGQPASSVHQLALMLWPVCAAGRVAASIARDLAALPHQNTCPVTVLSALTPLPLCFINL